MVGQDGKHGRALVWLRTRSEPLNPRPNSATVIDSGTLPVDLQWREQASPNVNIDEAPPSDFPEQVATQKRPENQRTDGRSNGGTRAVDVVRATCTVRDPKDSSAPRYQDGKVAVP